MISASWSNLKISWWNSYRVSSMWLLTVGLMMMMMMLSLQRFADARTIRRIRPEGTAETMDNHMPQTTQSIDHEPDFNSTEVPSILLPDSEEAGSMEVARFSTARRMLEKWKNLLKELHQADEEEEEEEEEEDEQGAESGEDSVESGEDSVESGEDSVERVRKVKRDAEKKEEIGTEKKSERLSATDEKKMAKKAAAEDKEKDKRSNQDAEGRREAASAVGAADAEAAAAAEEAEAEEEEEEEEQEEEQKEEQKKEKTGVAEKKKRHYQYKDAGMDESDFEKDEESKTKRHDDVQEEEEEEEEKEDEEEEDQDEEQEEEEQEALKQRRYSKQKRTYNELYRGRSQRTPHKAGKKYLYPQQSKGKHRFNNNYRRNYRGPKAFNKESNDYRRSVYRDLSDEGNYRQRRHRFDDDNRRRFWRYAEDDSNYEGDIGLLRDIRNADIARYDHDEVMRADRHADVNAANNYDIIRNLRKAVDHGKSREEENLARYADNEKRSDYDYRKVRHAYDDVKTGEDEEFRGNEARRIRHADDEGESSEYEGRKMRYADDDRKRFYNRLRRIRYAGDEDKASEEDEDRERRLAVDDDRTNEDEVHERRNTVDKGYKFEDDAAEHKQLKQAETDSGRTGEKEEERRVRHADADADAADADAADAAAAADDDDEKITEYKGRRIRHLDDDKRRHADDDNDKERNMRYAEDDGKNMDREEERKMRKADDDARVEETRRRRLVDDDRKRSTENEADENERKLMGAVDESDLDEDRSHVKRWIARSHWDSDLPQGKRSTDEQTYRRKARSRRGSAAYGLLISGLVPRLAKIRQSPTSIEDEKHPASENATGKMELETGEISSERIMPGTEADNGTEVGMQLNEKHVHVSNHENPHDEDKGLNATESENYTKAEGTSQNSGTGSKVYDLQSPVTPSEDQGKRLLLE